MNSFVFLNKFEAKCLQFNDKDFKLRLQTSQLYKQFVKKWPLQVYYQIRFQEIVSKIEENLYEYNKPNEIVDSEDKEAVDHDPNYFCLKISDTVVKQIEYCWCESKCFLNSLLSQFWKLNLQIISRYCSFFSKLLQDKIFFLEKNEQLPTQLNKLQIEQIETVRSKSPAENCRAVVNESRLESNNLLPNDLDLSVLLLLDVDKLYAQKLPNFFDGIITPIMRSVNVLKDISLLKEAFNCSLNNLNELRGIINEFINKNQANICLEYLKNVNDIARLYRRTNREV